MQRASGARGIPSRRLSPIDRHGRPLTDLRVSVTDRCNFRCGYCMPRDVYHEGYAFLPRRDILTFEEVHRVVRVAVSELGVRKLRLTGGEPLLRKDLPRLVEMLAGVGGVEDIALTTNGQLLARHAHALARAGLRRVSVSLDALDQTTFAAQSGDAGSVERVLEGIECAQAAGLSPIKLNCVVQRGKNEHAIESLARYGRERGITVRFIEFMDVGTLNAWTKESVVSADEILARVARDFPLEARMPSASVAERYRYRDGRGEVGVIASITRPFCGECTRARLSADGRFVTCLFAAGGLGLRDMLRGGITDAALANRMARVWEKRDDRYSELRAELATRGDAAGAKRRLQMYEIGG